MNKIKILIVDDDEITLNIILNVLSTDFEVASAKDGLLGFNTYKSFKPDIIISDINMPVLNGIEMTKKIRETDKNSKIILLTAYSDVEYLLSATELMLTKYLIKPINVDALLESVDIAIKDLNSFDFVFKNVLNLKDNSYWDYLNESFYHDDKEVILTPKERKLLKYLFKNPSVIKTYDEIIYFIWEDNGDEKQNLKTLVTGLRKKIPEDIILNIYGVGYKILTTF